MEKPLNKLAQEIFNNAKAKGFYEDGAATNTGERLCLIHSEVSEALEADRKGKYTSRSVALNNILNEPNDEIFKIYFKETVKDTHEDELSDVIIRCLDHAAYKGIDIDTHVALKMRYNSLREYKHGKKY